MAQQADSMVEVTQADRDAAFEWLYPHKPNVNEMEVLLLAEAFARHRINSIASLASAGYVIVPNEPTEAERSRSTPTGEDR